MIQFQSRSRSSSSHFSAGSGGTNVLSTKYWLIIIIILSKKGTIMELKICRDKRKQEFSIQIKKYFTRKRKAKVDIEKVKTTEKYSYNLLFFSVSQYVTVRADM